VLRVIEHIPVQHPGLCRIRLRNALKLAYRLIIRGLGMCSVLCGRLLFSDAKRGAMAGAGYLLIGRKLRANMSLISYISVVYGMAAVVLLMIMFAAGYKFFGYSPQSYVWLILLAIIPQLLGHSSFNWALGYLSAAFVSITLLGEPIASTILASIILDEKPTPIKITGGILILMGIYISSRSEGKKSSELPD